MLFHIRHALRYTYERPVFLEPTTLRLTPRNDPAQQLIHHSLTICPEASGSCRVLEADGGEAVVLWFAPLQEELQIEVDMVVRTLRDNPFDWIVTDLDNAFAIETAMQSTHTGNYPTPGMAPTFNLVNRVFSELKVFVVDPQFNWPANTLMGFDSRNAITRVTNVSAAYSAVESFVLRRSTVMRMDVGEFAHREFDDAFDTLSLTLTSGS